MDFDTRINPGDIVAVGDIHARYDLLSVFLDYARGSEATVIFLGDLIDRGGEDLRVVEKVRDLIENPESEGLSNVFCLMGNHEKMFLDAVEKGTPELYLWLHNGGNFDQYADLMNHTEWFNDLPIFMTIGETMFIHAGFYPGLDPTDTINRGHCDKILWIREPFLTEGPRFDQWNPQLKQVVFGHTPKGPLPYYLPTGDGVCIDTAAFQTGVLTSYNVTLNTFASHELTHA